MSDNIIIFDNIDYHRAKQQWKIENMLSQIKLILVKLLDIVKLALILDEPCPPPQQFDLLWTIGKY